MSVCSRIITDHEVAGPVDMRVAVAEATKARNALSRSEGFSLAQCVFGILPKGPGDQFDEDEFADLGVL